MPASLILLPAAAKKTWGRKKNTKKEPHKPHAGACSTWIDDEIEMMPEELQNVMPRPSCCEKDEAEQREASRLIKILKGVDRVQLKADAKAQFIVGDDAHQQQQQQFSSSSTTTTTTTTTDERRRRRRFRFREHGRRRRGERPVFERIKSGENSGDASERDESGADAKAGGIRERAREGSRRYLEKERESVVSFHLRRRRRVRENRRSFR